MSADPRELFAFRDGERLIRFGPGTLVEAVELLGGPGYALLTTPRARATAPAVAAAARVVVEIGPGRVDDLAGDLLAEAGGPALPADVRLVALGGGRVIDTAKAVAAAMGPGARPMAIPTTLSGAEMTSLHRPARGGPAQERRRPVVVVNDPRLSASQPPGQLAASALNALAHAVEGPCTARANPVATLAAHEGARLLTGAFPSDPGSPDRDALALGALLSGYVIDSTGYGLHHVAAQALVREGGLAHADANAALLPHSVAALQRRAPHRIAAFGDALRAPVAEIAARLAAVAGAVRLRDLGLERAAIRRCTRSAAARPDLANTPPAADEAELRDLYERAY